MEFIGRQARTVVVLALAAAAFLIPLAFASDANAQLRNFSERFSDNARGDIAFAANTLLTCPPAHAQCPGAQDGSLFLNNNNFSLINVDVDGFVDQNSDTIDDTRNSSRADLNMPAGSNVLFAGLYWGGVEFGGLDPTDPADIATFGSVRFDVPGPGGYQDINATASCSTPPPHAACVDGVSAGSYWQGYADVTSQVQVAGAGQYTLGDAKIRTGTNRFGGWTLVVAYEHASEDWRNLAIFDGLAAGGLVQLSGFTTPPTGNFNVRFGTMSYDGDNGGNDNARFEPGAGSTTIFRTLSDALNPANDFFNGRITRLGAHVTTKVPNYVNQLGYDSKIVAGTGGGTGPPATHIANNVTSATVRVTRGSDFMANGLMWTGIDVYAPDVTGTKTIVNTTDPGQPAEGDDVLEYQISYENRADDPNDPVDRADEFVITDPIPANMTYVPGTLAIDSGANAGVKTDTSGDDQAEFTGTSAVFRVGAGGGSGANDGGMLNPSEQVTVSFQVQVNTASPGHLSTNTATGDFTGRILSAESFSEDASASIPVIPVHDLVLDKSGPATVTPGQSMNYTLNVTNNGPSTSDQTTLTDTLPAGLTYDDGNSDNRCDQTGTNPTVVTCTLGSLAGNGANTSVTIATTVDLTATGTLENDAEVTDLGPTPESNPNNNTDSITTQIVIPPPEADLRLSKTAPAGPFHPGDQIPYTLTVTNDGPDDSPATVVSDTLPAGLTYVSDDAGCDTSNLPGVDCDLGTLASGASATVTIVTRLDAINGPTVTNSAFASGGNADPDPGNNASSVPARVEPPATDDTLCFFGTKVTILGTNAPETILGTPGRDVINGRRGNDTILGLEGDDLICGGRGDDLIKGGPGNDRVKGSLGDDRIRGNLGDDWLRGAPGNDVITGRRGNDRLMGNNGNDRLRGRQGDDNLLGGPGTDRGHGGPGRDRSRGVETVFDVGLIK